MKIAHLSDDRKLARQSATRKRASDSFELGVAELQRRGAGVLDRVVSAGSLRNREHSQLAN